MEIHENFSLQSYNTFGVPAHARYFSEVRNTQELRSVMQQFGTEIPHLFLGGGSNVLLTSDFPGVVIHLNLKGIEKKGISENHVLVTAQAGENWHAFVQYCLSHEYGGLENLSLIPGNVGTSPMQNIGAYGVEIKDTFESCEVLNLETLETEIFTAQQCDFGYRESYFKKEGKNKYVILSVTFRLTTQHHTIKTSYGAIQEELKKKGIENPSIRQVSEAVIAIRQTKLPDPAVTGNAGSFFKNPVISQEAFIKIKEKYPHIPSYPAGEHVKVPAGWLIETAGWKGRQIGNVASHAQQALVLINKTGQATGQEIFYFSAELIRDVQQKFGITLEREVNII